MNKHIPQYKFNKEQAQHSGFEIIPIDRIYAKSNGSEGKPHRLNFYQILYCTGDVGTHVVDFKPIDFKKGTIIPLAKGQVQQFDTISKMQGYAILFTSEFLISGESEYAYLYDFTIFNHLLGQISIESNTNIQLLLELLIKEQQNHEGFENTSFLRNTLKNLLILMEREKRSHFEIRCDESLLLYQQFRQILEDNVSYKLKSNKIADQLNVPLKQLNAAVKLYANTTSKNYIEEHVILEAKRLLAHSSLSVKEIAYELGFEDPTNFTKYFKKRTETLPNKYRQTS
jgi:AraC-like DNA-binding protein